MNNEKIEIIKSNILNNSLPLLLFNRKIDFFPTAVVLESSCGIEDLNGHYEGSKFLPPDWYRKLFDNKDYKRILIINNIDKVDIDEQEKFIEIIKYKKISTFEIPENTIIILLADSVNCEISTRILSLVNVVEE